MADEDWITCDICGGRASKRTAGPNSKNPGLEFYSCDNQQCANPQGRKFFAWVDEHAQKSAVPPPTKKARTSTVGLKRTYASLGTAPATAHQAPPKTPETPGDAQSVTVAQTLQQTVLMDNLYYMLLELVCEVRQLKKEIVGKSSAVATECQLDNDADAQTDE